MKVKNMIKSFPDDYCLIHTLNNEQTKIFYDFDKNSLLARLGGKKNDYIFTEVIMVDRTIFLALRGFKIFSKPRDARSDGSSAVYLASSIDKNDGFLLQYLPPHSQTSKHYHNFRKEAYHIFAGKATIVADDKKLVLENGNSQVTGPSVIHQIYTEKESSLILLEMIDEKPGLGMSDHIYV
jgi:mannose-6-phosphate isomerase-like protein (cupin superfamily)